MPMYYFHLCDGKTLNDPDGTNVANVEAARDHAAGVARELTLNSHEMLDQGWSAWTMRVHDDQGLELFSLALSDFKGRDS